MTSVGMFRVWKFLLTGFGISHCSTSLSILNKLIASLQFSRDQGILHSRMAYAQFQRFPFVLDAELILECAVDSPCMHPNELLGGVTRQLPAIENTLHIWASPGRCHETWT